MNIPTGLNFDTFGLIPVVVQDHGSGDVLMVAFANAEALRKTADTGFAHFWSRSRRALWKKGETSGNTLRVLEVLADCDQDALLYIVDADGPTCHTGVRTCFGEATPTAAGMLEELRRVIVSRRDNPPEGSYTAKLLAEGLDKTLKKIGEESAEVVIAAKADTDDRLAEESADLLFHLLVVLEQRGIGPREVLEVLRRRRSGR